MEAAHGLKLFIRSGPLEGQTFPLPASRLVVGRDAACDLRFDDPKISRVHGWFETSRGQLYYTDNSSTNGSLLNGSKVETAMLEEGDVVAIGSSEIALVGATDFQSISFVNSDSVVTRRMQAEGVSAEAIADKFATILGQPPDGDPAESTTRSRRLLTCLRALQHATSRMSALLPVAEVLEVVGDGLFEVFGRAENLVILMRDGDKDLFTPRLTRNRAGDLVAGISISRTVLKQAVEDHATIIASDVDRDSRFSSSDSILGLSVKSVVCTPLIVGGRVLGALYLDSREQRSEYDDLDAEVLTAFANQAAIALDNARLNDDLQESYHQMLQALVRAIEAKDPYTSGHTARVKEYTLTIARQLGFSHKRLERLAMAADLHDIGKIGVKEGIINKPGSLTDTEYSDIKMHVEMGEMILKPVAYLKDLLPWIRGHHEKWDGTGYPDGLRGEACPLEGRILAVADAFDAMTSQRPYNKPLGFQEALERIKSGAGTHFDPQVVAAFDACFSKQGDATGGIAASARPENQTKH